MSLKVCVVFAAMWVMAMAACSDHSNAIACTEATGCFWRPRVSLCVNGGFPKTYIWVNVGETTYAQIANTDFSGDEFHGPELTTDDTQLEWSKAAPSATRPANPVLGELVPRYNKTVNIADQPPLVQPAGTFAYLYRNMSEPDSAFPKEDSFEFYYGDHWGMVHITIIFAGYTMPTYRCRDSAGEHTDTSSTATGPSNWCFAGASNSNDRPWVTKKVLPPVWSQLTSDPNADILEYAPTNTTEGIDIRWVNNALNITAYGRMGHMGQRVYGFEQFQYYNPNTFPTQTYNLNEMDSSAAKIPKTMTFDRTCVAAAATQGTATSWSTTFNGLSKTANATVPSDYPSQCTEFAHGPLCGSAPLLTVSAASPGGSYGPMWSTMLEGCTIATTGIFPLDLMLNYCYDGTHNTGCTHNVFTFDDQYYYTFVTFSFFNTAIQPNSWVNPSRGWQEIHHEYQVSLTLKSTLDFAFETGIDIFTVDIQWFRYSSEYQTLSCGLNDASCQLHDRGLGINLIVYPDGYNAAYGPRSPLITGTNKHAHSNSPKKVLAINWYTTSQNTQPSEYYNDDLSYNGLDKHFKVHACATEQSDANTQPTDSCDFQNVTVRIRMKNNNESVGQTWGWTQRMVFQFTLNNGEHPNFIMDPNYKQTALETTGSFSGKTATCRTYPELFEHDVMSRDPLIVHEGAEQNTEEACKNLDQETCGPSARESGTNIHNGTTPFTHAGYGCEWNYYRALCVPAYSVTCQEVGAKVFGPTDRAIVVMDVTDVDTTCTAIKRVTFKYSSGGRSYVVHAVYPNGEAGVTALDDGSEYLFPKYEFLHYQPLSKLQRNMYPLPQTNEWDYGFVFQPGTVNDATTMTIEAVLTIHPECTNPNKLKNKNKNKRFTALQANGDTDIAINEEFKLNSKLVSHAVNRVQQSAPQQNVAGGVLSHEGSRKTMVTVVNNTPLYITLAVMGVAIVAALVGAVVYVRNVDSAMKMTKQGSSVHITGDSAAQQ